MDGIYIRWSVENWITVLLMAAAGYLVFALAAQLFLKPKALSSATDLKVVG